MKWMKGILSRDQQDLDYDPFKALPVVKVEE